MYSTMRSSGNNSAFLFFVTWVLIGKFTLLSLFLAVIMEAFEVAHERHLQEKTILQAMEQLRIGMHPEGLGTHLLQSVLRVLENSIQNLQADSHLVHVSLCTAASEANTSGGVSA